MNKEVIRDEKYRILGWIVTEDDGRQKAFDFVGRLLGTYYPDRDTTNDFTGRVVYRGNKITAMIPNRIEDIQRNNKGR